MNNKITNNKITKNEKIAKRSQFAKKAILFMVVSMIIMTVTAVTAFAAGGGGQVDTKPFSFCSHSFHLSAQVLRFGALSI